MNYYVSIHRNLYIETLCMKTVDAEVTVGVQSQRAGVAEIPAQRSLSNGPLRALSKGMQIPEYQAT